VAKEEASIFPEVGHVYVMAVADDSMIADYDAVEMGREYGELLSAVRSQVEIWNRDNAAQRYVVGGGAG
jgi:hypothetical protein